MGCRKLDSESMISEMVSRISGVEGVVLVSIAPLIGDRIVRRQYEWLRDDLLDGWHAEAREKESGDQFRIIAVENRVKIFGCWLPTCSALVGFRVSARPTIVILSEMSSCFGVISRQIGGRDAAKRKV